MLVFETHEKISYNHKASHFAQHVNDLISLSVDISGCGHSYSTLLSLSTLTHLLFVLGQ